MKLIGIGLGIFFTRLIEKQGAYNATEQNTDYNRLQYKEYKIQLMVFISIDL